MLAVPGHLSRAWMRAAASVDDEATRRWMATLYRGRFANGLGTAEAVRAASLEVLRERRAHGISTHPFFWAPFVAAGEWR